MKSNAHKSNSNMILGDGGHECTRFNEFTVSTMGVLQSIDVATGNIVVSKIANQDVLNMEILVVNRQ